MAQPKRTGAVWGGFFTVFGMLLLVFFLPTVAPEFSRVIGRGGWPYPGVPIGAAVVGGLLMRFVPEPGGKAFGKGLLFGGLFGLLVLVVLIVLFMLGVPGKQH